MIFLPKVGLVPVSSDLSLEMIRTELHFTVVSRSKSPSKVISA